LVTSLIAGLRAITPTAIFSTVNVVFSQVSLFAGLLVLVLVLLLSFLSVLLACCLLPGTCRVATCFQPRFWPLNVSGKFRYPEIIQHLWSVRSEVITSDFCDSNALFLVTVRMAYATSHWWLPQVTCWGEASFWWSRRVASLGIAPVGIGSS